jgi:chitin biosynthesis protein CHS5
MSRTPTRVQFTVGKLDAGMAILLTQDHYQIEFPSILLPKTVTAGSIIDLSVTQNPSQEAKIHSQFLQLQSTIHDAFAAKSPSTPRLTLRNATQTSAVLEWEPIDIATAELKSLTLWRDGTRLGNIPKPLATTTTKLSGLGIDTGYTFQLILRTTAGTYPSDPLKIKTHKMSNLSGITVCAGTLPEDQLERLTNTIDTIGAKPLQKRVRIDTTHFICSVPTGEEYNRAQEMNVPVVVVDWIEACQSEGKIVGVRGYYLDADPALRPKGTVTSPKPRASQVQEFHASTSQIPTVVVSEDKGEAKESAVPTGPSAAEATSTEATAAVDPENERVLSTAEDVGPPIVREETSVPAPVAAPAPIETSEELEVAQETEAAQEEHEVKVKVEDSADNFDDVPI